ncbi:MAG: HAMP domain-containing histidine kinase [Microbacteriaceae bacterium]|jgi:two-component system sensor histidine kinase MtrB|nr:HAMP domain-containing histidine kinase [Microbacteriaceae bacterium]HOA86959.1 MtrAB system histidine kinase MtrB [Microbacteriaceae bacterium]HPZ33759.1 MtrAB system histidine kinase MtrB [Microbacteriaceae bacterium]HQC92757.1 MtrAB system histidine kinase MtrB [Microbacteriaceae bacterium]
MIARSVVPIDWSDVRTWPGALRAAWRRSLRFRTMVLTLTLTAGAILVACLVMAVAIQSDLFQSRLNQVLADARRATTAAQASLDAAEVTDRIETQQLLTSVRGSIVRQSSTELMAVFRVPGQPISGLAPQPFTTGLTSEHVSAQLREAVEAGANGQWWQSVALPAAGGSTVPGIVVGQQLQLPSGAGAYELYLGYDLTGADETLGFVQRTLWLAGLALIALIGAISWFVLRSITIPIGEAADTSARLAAGELEVRLPVRGEDELATLGRSFNAMADSIQGQIHKLAELSLVQQRFVSDVSHELRTPLTTIRLASEMINDQRAGFDPATGRAAELLHAQVERFELLLTDLLEISRYDAGSVQLEWELKSLTQLTEDVVASMHQLAEQHGSLVRVLSPGGHTPSLMDPRRVRRIVRNLIGNAIEHGEGRPIVVTIDSNREAVAVGVRDFGMGMRPEHVGHVFDRFWRADPSRKRSIGGTGLGLSIALGDAHLHGGTLGVWSEPGRGTHFVLTLPRRRGIVEPESPIALEPSASADDIAALLESTAPIDVSTLVELNQPESRGEGR